MCIPFLACYKSVVIAPTFQYTSAFPEIKEQRIVNRWYV